MSFLSFSTSEEFYLEGLCFFISLAVLLELLS